MNYNHIFWDWNGTLLDDLRYSVDTVNYSLKKRGLTELTLEKYLATFRFPIIDYYRELGFDFTKESYENLADEYAKLYEKDCKSLSLFAEAKEVLAVFAGKKLHQYILSASEKTILTDALDYYGIAKYFETVLALDNFYADSKIEIGKRFVSTLPADEKCLIVGDSEHDAEVAKAIGIDCILCSRGHGSKERLSELSVPVVENFYELYPYIFGENSAKKQRYRTINPDSAERLSFNIEESFPNDFRTKYKDFYDDLKNTTKTEDW